MTLLASITQILDIDSLPLLCGSLQVLLAHFQLRSILTCPLLSKEAVFRATYAPELQQ